MLYIGVDLGTSAVKLVLMDSEGSIKNIVSKGYPLDFPKPGWSEQNPADWKKAVFEGIKELIEKFDKNEINAVSFGGQMHGLVILDEKEDVIRPAILWNDSRTSVETDFLNKKIGKEKLSDCTANIAFAGFTAPKILWVKNNEPENFSKIRKILLPKDYIAFLMSGVYSTDYSDASGMLLLDVKNKRWSAEMIDICGIKEDMLPKLFESYEVVGEIKEDVAKELGLRSDVKIVAGAGDNAAAAIGTGTVGNCVCNISLGTSGTVFISSEKFLVDKNNSIHSFAHADGNFHLLGCMLSAAACNKWWIQNILKTNDFEFEQREFSKLGENRVFFLPYLMGERSPYNDVNARGAFVGMSMDTPREKLTQAVFEGVAFALRDLFEVVRSLGINIDKAKICGGGAKSKIWKKIIANVLNVELQVLECEEGPGFGAAILAAVGAGEFSSVEEACKKIVRIIDNVEPETELVEKYETSYRKFKQIYPALKGVFIEICK